MLSKILSLFTWIKDAVVGSPIASAVWSIVFGTVKSKAVNILTDANLRNLAYDTAVELRKDNSLNGLAKAAKFNETIFAYVKQNNLGDISTSAVNLLRELVCQSLANKEESGE